LTACKMCSFEQQLASKKSAHLLAATNIVKPFTSIFDFATLNSTWNLQLTCNARIRLWQTNAKSTWQLVLRIEEVKTNIIVSLKHLQAKLLTFKKVEIVRLDCHKWNVGVTSELR
jgi:hypothetical protein